METRERWQAKAEHILDKDATVTAGMPMNGTDTGSGNWSSGDDEMEVIHPLLDVIPDGDGRGNQEIIVIDGRVYERELKPEDKIYELTDIVEHGKGDVFGNKGLNEEMARIAARTAEMIAREIVPGIAERVIREEIEKLKRDYGVGTDT